MTRLSNSSIDRIKAMAQHPVNYLYIRYILEVVMDQPYFAQWQPSYSVGDRVLDDQHKKLLGLCQQAIQCMSDDSRDGLELFHDILNDLSNYVNEHFRTEEALLSLCGYPLLEQHKEEHTDYQLKLTDFLLSATLGEINKEGLHHYLSHWWSEHILGSDRQYTAAVQGFR